MLLKRGYSYKTVRENIAQMQREGYPPDQAVAAAYENARRDYFKRYPQGALPQWLAYPDGRSMKKNPCACETRSKNPVPPSSRASTKNRELRVQDAAKLYERFTGHVADELVEVDKPVMPDVVLVVGDIDGVLYTTVRDGKVEQYKHEFKKNCRPLFCVSHDGKQIFMLGGSYDFTERGIVDRT